MAHSLLTPRKAETEADINKLLVLMKRFAKVLGMTTADGSEAHREALKKHLMSHDAIAEACLLEDRGEAIGYCVFYWTFSTFHGKPNLFVEDLFIGSDERGKDLGKDLLAYLSYRAHEKGSGKVHLSFPKANKKLRKYYARLGFVPEQGWSYMRYPITRLWEDMPKHWEPSESKHQ